MTLYVSISRNKAVVEANEHQVECFKGSNMG